MIVQNGKNRRLGVVIVGLGGAVATTAVAGIELLRMGRVGRQGLPLASLDETLTEPLAEYTDLVFGGWDFCDDDLAQAAQTHNVLDAEQFAAVAPALAQKIPWPAVGNERFCRNVSGSHLIKAGSHEEAIEVIRRDLRTFRATDSLAGLVVVNLASTEASFDPHLPVFADLEHFREGLAQNDAAIGPAMLYAYAAIAEGVPYANFTPSVAADVPALIQFAEQEGVPVAGKDGKTGQTFIKTVLAPGLHARALEIEGWFSTNILGNRDGVALRDKDSLASKIGTKGSVLDQILGYKVEDHVVNIEYYKPRGDNKEAWDSIDLIGFLGQKMQLKVNFLCRDSILAAPLVVELARLLDLASQKGEGGVQEHLGVFFKSPMMADPEAQPEHALHRQQEALVAWLEEHSNVPAA
ncbi:MAG: inositol-3-phosphate synthase [Rhodothermales bacterium]